MGAMLLKVQAFGKLTSVACELASRTMTARETTAMLRLPCCILVMLVTALQVYGSGDELKDVGRRSLPAMAARALRLRLTMSTADI